MDDVDLGKQILLAAAKEGAIDLLSICDRDNFGDIDPWMEMMKEA